MVKTKIDTNQNAHTKAVMTVVTLCDGNVTNRHDVTVSFVKYDGPFKSRHTCDGPNTFCDGLGPQIYSHYSQVADLWGKDIS